MEVLEKETGNGKLARSRKMEGGVKLFRLWKKGMSLLSNRLALCPPMSLIHFTLLFTLRKKSFVYPMLKQY